MPLRTETPEIVAFLNEILAIDPDAISQLFGLRVACNQQLAEHPTVQVLAEDDRYQVGILGLLNGFCGTIDHGDRKGWGGIIAHIDDAAISEFSHAPATPEAGPEKPAEPSLPPGDYAIVEIMGHRTIVGRVEEVERFGTKLIAIEPLLAGQLLPAVLIGGSSLYQFTPCSAEVALQRCPTEDWHLPASVRAAIPATMLPAPKPAPAGDYVEFCQECGLDDTACDCRPF